MSYGIILDHPKKDGNIGGVLRSAHCFDADFVGLIGTTYSYEVTDTTRATRHVPVCKYSHYNNFLDSKPIGWDMVGVEFVDASENILNFAHPRSALYLFGPENSSLDPDLMRLCKYVIKIPTRYCLNLATSASIVMYDRISKCVKHT